jgi:putative ABC transport system permease protein
VVKDFHYTSLHEPIGPFVIFLSPEQVRQLFVKVSGKNITGTIQHFSGIWKERVAHRPFEYHFLDEDYAAYIQQNNVQLRSLLLFLHWLFCWPALVCLP